MPRIQLDVSATIHLGHVSNNEFGKVNWGITVDTDKEVDWEQLLVDMKHTYEIVTTELDKNIEELIDVQIIRSADRKKLS
jgi:hypothetical protein